MCSCAHWLKRQRRLRTLPAVEVVYIESESKDDPADVPAVTRAMDARRGACRARRQPGGVAGRGRVARGLPRPRQPVARAARPLPASRGAALAWHGDGRRDLALRLSRLALRGGRPLQPRAADAIAWSARNGGVDNPILGEDRAVVESQSGAVPDDDSEISVATDAPSIAFRRWYHRELMKKTGAVPAALD